MVSRRQNVPGGWGDQYQDYVPDRYQNNAPRRLNPEVGSQENVIEGHRRRHRANYSDHNHLSTNMTYYSTFLAAISQPETTKLFGELPKVRLYRDQLPPPPKRYRDVATHPFANEFQKAMNVEFDNCWKKGCFAQTPATSSTADAEVLPLMWVYTYKFDQDGYLYKFKARLVVRGDLQAEWGDTYAATLAARVFRGLIALAAAFDLLMFQYDALNAFLNARVNRKLFCYTPEGFAKQYGELLLIRRALYGLKEAPLLWYAELQKTLKKLGLKAVPGVPCLFANNNLIVFFYVDDIVVLVHPSKTSYKEEFEKRLLQIYDLRILGELSWFLGIRVIRDRPSKSIWLIQDSFINKVASKFNLTSDKGYPDFPIKENVLPPSTEEPNSKRTKIYQQLVGSLAYIATFTRPDVARAHSVLARHLANPGQKHLYAAIHCWRYLIGKRNLALKASGTQNEKDLFVIPVENADKYTDTVEPIFYGASDAAYADEPDTRRSSEGYLFKLYGLSVDWKAAIQKTVTKSTTEAELLALSRAGGEMEWWNRLFREIRFNPDIVSKIWCDNQQTVGIVTKAEEKLQTKLKHVDIHQLWLRQEVEAGRIHVDWKPTAYMPADGLTKVLPRQKHAQFIKQLGLEDVSDRLITTIKDINNESLLEIHD
ncbi:Pol protein [Pyrenophora tritici-repentis]|nr:Pol protein [Pyrenophora tritici-repentis]